MPPTFHYKNNILHIGNIAIDKIAQQIPTPFFLYSADQIRANYHKLASALQQRNLPVDICYALKANYNRAVLKTIADCGAGGDVVSVGELKRAIDAGIPAQKIVFSGVGKSRKDLEYALDQRIMQINVESVNELSLLGQLCHTRNQECAIGIRVNPDISANTHDKISTGGKETKFGIAIEHLPQINPILQQYPQLKLRALAIHIGSQISDVTPFRHAFKNIKQLYDTLQQQHATLTKIDLGGGLGVDYQPGQALNIDDYGDAIADICDENVTGFMIEPGRVMVADCGLLVTQLLYHKYGLDKEFYIVDAAMNDLIRPTLYNAYHDILAVQQPHQDHEIRHVDIVGPVCETGDYFAQSRAMPLLPEGALLAISHAGAYGAVMSSSYNARDIATEIMVKDDDFFVARKAITIEDMLAFERAD